MSRKIRWARLAGFLAGGAVFLALALECAGVFSIIRFTRERIEITVRPRAIEVNGTYVYANPLPFPWTRGLRVPFPVDANHPAPATVAVTEVQGEVGLDLAEIPVRWFWNEPYFTIRIPPRGSTAVRVRFVQPSADEKGTYLLLTTKPWGRPLEHGDYILKNDGVRITGSNYALDGPDGLSFSRERFMPEQDWTFTWTTEVIP